MDFQYKSVAIMLDNKQKGGDISQQLTSKINIHSEGGWEFVSLDSANIKVSPGCLGSLLGQKATYIKYDFLIYRRPKG